jgi:hypothetical protein
MKFLVAVFIFALLGFGYLYFQPQINQQLSRSSNKYVYCDGRDIKSTYVADGAAGSIYGTLTMTNTSNGICQIYGDSYVTAAVEAGNVNLVRINKNSAAPIVLQPGQSIYSQTQYQNGGQCSDGTLNSTLTLSYRISSRDTVYFQDPGGDTHQNITICKSASEPTELKVWALANDPISQ